MDIFSFETLTQFAICTIPFSLGLASYSYYKSVTYRINYNKKLNTFVDNVFEKLAPKYITLVEKVLENLTESYNYSPPTSSFSFKDNIFPDSMHDPVSRAPSPQRPPSPINRQSDKKDIGIPEFDIETLIVSDNEGDGNIVDIPPLNLTSSIILPPQDTDVNHAVDTALNDVTQMVEEEMIPEIEANVLRQRKVESLNEMTSTSSVVELD